MFTLKGEVTRLTYSTIDLFETKKPTRIPANPKEFEKLLRTIRLSKFLTQSITEYLAKSTYASSTTTTPLNSCKIFSMSPNLNWLPVGLLGEQRTRREVFPSFFSSIPSTSNSKLGLSKTLP